MYLLSLTNLCHVVYKFCGHEISSSRGQRETLTEDGGKNDSTETMPSIDRTESEIETYHAYHTTALYFYSEMSSLKFSTVILNLLSKMFQYKAYHFFCTRQRY